MAKNIFSVEFIPQHAHPVPLFSEEPRMRIVYRSFRILELEITVAELLQFIFQQMDAVDFLLYNPVFQTEHGMHLFYFGGWCHGSKV
jgi:hypothetical protein